MCSTSWSTAWSCGEGAGGCWHPQPPARSGRVGGSRARYSPGMSSRRSGRFGRSGTCRPDSGKRRSSPAWRVQRTEVTRRSVSAPPRGSGSGPRPPASRQHRSSRGSRGAPWRLRMWRRPEAREPRRAHGLLSDGQPWWSAFVEGYTVREWIHRGAPHARCRVGTPLRLHGWTPSKAFTHNAFQLHGGSHLTGVWFPTAVRTPPRSRHSRHPSRRCRPRSG